MRLLGGTPVEISDRVAAVLRAVAPAAGGGVRWQYDLYVDGALVINNEDDLVTSDYGPEDASRVLAGSLLADILLIDNRTWPMEILIKLCEVRPDLENWGGAVLEKRRR